MATKTKIILAPSRYVQGANELKNLASHTLSFGNKDFIMADEFVINITKDILKKSYSQKTYVLEKFLGESSKEEINRLIKLVKENKCDVIVGIGGGKVADTCKAVAYYLNLPVVVVPTIASTNASCSKLAVIYSKDGVFEEYLKLKHNPEMVLVDTKIISAAPSRLFVAGVGDALATYFEARACKNSDAINFAGGVCSSTAYDLAKLCYRLLIQNSLRAKHAIDNGYKTNSVERAIEANIYLSALGSESGGLAGAHSVHNGFTTLKECEHLYHGEKVAFGIVVQLVLEKANATEVADVLDLCKSVGLPTTLKEMGLENITKEQLELVANTAVKKGETIHNMPFEVTAEMVKKAIIEADRLGNIK